MSAALRVANGDVGGGPGRGGIGFGGGSGGGDGPALCNSNSAAFLVWSAPMCLKSRLLD